MLFKINTASLSGLEALPVCMELSANFRNNRDVAPPFIMVGLPDNAVKESRMRVAGAILSLGVKEPPNIAYAVNLAPADVKKEGTGFDLPLAIGMLAALKKVKADLFPTYLMVGELGLDGSIRPIKGALSIAIKARAMHYEGLIVPMQNAREAAVVDRLKVFGASTLTEVINHLNGTQLMEQTEVNTREEFYAAQSQFPFDFAEVKGQYMVKRALEIAAAGSHNVILIGSPGCGKSMLAKRVPSILPPLTLAESLETTRIHSVAGTLSANDTLLTQRPFRAPHHTISDVALIGGGVQCKPGEISMAHNGVLFLDELPEFSRAALETLRQPLEDREITISRVKYSVTLPCSFMLVASMNPCPCGYYTHPTHECTCSPAARVRYMNRISGPLLDRIDIQVNVSPVSVQELASEPDGEPSAAIRQRVIRARQIQTERYKDIKGIHSNAQMTRGLLDKYAKLDEEGMATITKAMARFNLSARSYDRILRLSRTIADLAGEPNILPRHIKEAISYRNLDRGDWGL